MGYIFLTDAAGLRASCRLLRPIILGPALVLLCTLALLVSPGACGRPLMNTGHDIDVQVLDNGVIGAAEVQVVDLEKELIGRRLRGEPDVQPSKAAAAEKDPTPVCVHAGTHSLGTKY